MRTCPAAAAAATLGLALALSGCTTATPDPTGTPDPDAPATVAPGPDQTEEPSPTPTEPDLSPTSPSGPAVSPSPSPLPEPDPAAEESPFPADRSVDTASTSGDVFLSSTDLRFGVHEGYDRIVLDLAGEGLPGWRAEYVEDPTQVAAGEPVYLPGDAYLLVLVDGVLYPTEEGAVPFDGPRSILPQGAGVVEEVRYGALFEGKLEIWVGLSSDQPFRVFRLEDPTRVVIDIQHP